MRKDTLIIMTGGTIDAEAYPDPLHPPKDATMLPCSLIPAALANMGVAGRCSFLPWRAKDSKHVTDADIEDLARIIRTAEARTVIITHGTDAMAENGRRLKRCLERPDPALRDDAWAGCEAHVRGGTPLRDKRVILTGALMPLANGAASDAHENLSYIFSHMDGWEAGMRVVMHGVSYAPEGLVKNLGTYRFQGRILDGDRGAPAAGRGV